MAMATNVHQQTWVPYVPTKDCSMGFCSIYCPQWCYIIFPPPPPVEFSGDSSGVTFSPLVIAIIGILAGAFLLVCYYTIVTKYCSTFASLRRWFNPPGRDDRDLDDSIVGQSHRHEAWHGSPSNGLDEALISKITVYRYRRGDGTVQGTDCSVCLGEFREDDSLRLLPKCSHAFHLQCIDTWLRSHSNCPLCRANIVSVNPTAPPPPPQLQAAPESESNPEVEEAARVDEMVVVIEDAGVGAEEEAQPGSSGNSAKDPSQIYCDSRGMEEVDAIVEIRDDDIQPIRRSFSMDATNCGRVLIADVLRMTMEDELLAAKEGGFWTGTSSSRRVAGDHSKVRRSQESRGLHGVMSPVRMKRSFSNERFCLTRHAKGRNGLLPGQGASE